jgi:ATP-dependent DNA helicase PIF1
VRHRLAQLRRCQGWQQQEQHGEASVAVTAPTGVAACNVGGSTLNSFAGIGLGTEPADRLFATINRNERARARWRECKVLVVDEVSMLDGGMFDKLDYLARRVRGNERAVAFYESVGFALTTDHQPLPSDPCKDELRMTRAV